MSGRPDGEPGLEADCDGCDAASLLALAWSSLTELLGTAAAATLVRRSVGRAATRRPELTAITISRERFEYRLDVAPAWSVDARGALDGLREIGRELHDLLTELTGQVVLQRLRGVAELERCRVLPPESES